MYRYFKKTAVAVFDHDLVPRINGTAVIDIRQRIRPTKRKFINQRKAFGQRDRLYLHTAVECVTTDVFHALVKRDAFQTRIAHKGTFADRRQLIVEHDLLKSVTPRKGVLLDGGDIFGNDDGCEHVTASQQLILDHGQLRRKVDLRKCNAIIKRIFTDGQNAVGKIDAFHCFAVAEC